MGERNRAMIVEVEPSGLTWRKSIASGGGGTNCLEIAALRDSVLIRHSRDRQGARRSFTYPAWRAFVASARDGECDLTR